MEPKKAPSRALMWGLLLGAVVLIAIFVWWLGAYGTASADKDPCAKEAAAARAQYAVPAKDRDPAVQQRLKDCRSRTSGAAPWKRDGGVTDSDAYEEVPCPKGTPAWRKCERPKAPAK
jgi:hypothetical protein